jgi:hypothetical protein
MTVMKRKSGKPESRQKDERVARHTGVEWMDLRVKRKGDIKRNSTWKLGT